MCIFPKGLDHGFSQKIKTFLIYCFNANRAIEGVVEYFETKRSLIYVVKKID